jgi:hypothetical protein
VDLLQCDLPNPLLPPVKILSPLQGYVNYNFKQNQFETTLKHFCRAFMKGRERQKKISGTSRGNALKLLVQSFASFTKIGSPNANIVKI